MNKKTYKVMEFDVPDTLFESIGQPKAFGKSSKKEVAELAELAQVGNAYGKSSVCEVAELAGEPSQNRPYGKSLGYEVAELAEPKKEHCQKSYSCEVAELAQVETNGKTLLFEVAELADVAQKPDKPRLFYKPPVYPYPSRVRAHILLNLFSLFTLKEIGGIRPLCTETWQTWQKRNLDKIRKSWDFLKKETAKHPGNKKRQCRREIITCIIRSVLAEKPDLETLLIELREKYKEKWANGKVLILPAKLLRKAGESVQDWDLRCMRAAGFVLAPKSPPPPHNATKGLKT